MSVDWNKELANKGVEDTWEFTKLKYDEVVDLCIPCVGSKKKKKSTGNVIRTENMSIVGYTIVVHQHGCTLQHHCGL